MNKSLRGLYVLSDVKTPMEKWAEVTEQVLRGGAELFQLREKFLSDAELARHAQELNALCQHYSVPFILNDRVELAKKIGADGVHLGQSDASLATALEFLGPKTMIGVSCYNQPALAYRAQQLGATYVAFGSMHTSPTKPSAARMELEQLKEARKKLSIAVCAIGGITLTNAVPIITAGVDLIACADSVFNASQPQHAAQAISSLFIQMAPA